MWGLALWLVSCTGTETPIDDLGNIPEESIPSGTGNMFSLAMRIPLPNDYMSTKAYEGVDRGSISEILIDGVRMVLYEGGVVKYCLDLDIQVQPDNNDFKVTGSDLYNWATDGNRIFIQTIARTFERSNYDMLIVINMFLTGFDATTLKPLVLSCLSFFLAVADEHMVLCMEVEKLQTLLLRLFDRIRIPNINSNDNNNIDEVCANRELISHALRLLQVCTYILLYNSSNNHKLGLILRNCLVRAWCGRDV